VHGHEVAMNDAEHLADVEQQIAGAWLARDQPAIEAVLATDWSVTDAAGQVLTREQVLDEFFGSLDRVVETMVVDDVHVRAFGDAAVVTGRTRASGSYRGTRAEVTLRFTDVFVRREGRWQAVASHASAVVA
jgi:ketosteroid isomerase-like protein